MTEIIVDNFAGGGGASTGISLAIGRSVDIAINHDPSAIAMHKANHPDTEHYCESVWDVDPVKACKGRPVSLAWFSPDCTHHSKARGGKPRQKNIRGLAWIAVKWAIAVKPRVIMLENVEEFKDWGPLDEDGYPIKSEAGRTFYSFIDSLKALGYEVQFRELRACDYGAPTIRKRLFMIARCDGKPIVWPEPTHGETNTLEVQAGLLKPWRSSSEVIDWSIPCPSIFTRKKPLAENTLKRIARGMHKFVLNNHSPFIVRIGQTGFGGDRLQYEPDKPLTTITTKAEHCLVAPMITVNASGHSGGKITEPLRTITTGGNHALVAPFLTSYHSETQPREVRGLSLNSPIHTLDTSNRFGLVTAFIAKNYGGYYNGAGTSMEEPLSIVTTVDHNSLVVAFLLKYYGSDIGQSLKQPLHTITTKDRFGLVKVDGDYHSIADIGFRMLQPRELFDAQGFPADYIIDRDSEGNQYPKTQQVAKCGNSVPPVFSEHLVRSNLKDICSARIAG